MHYLGVKGLKPNHPKIHLIHLIQMIYPLAHVAVVGVEDTGVMVVVRENKYQKSIINNQREREYPNDLNNSSGKKSR